MRQQPIYYRFDGSYPGFLCSVFESFEKKEWNILPISVEDRRTDLFGEECRIHTDEDKALRVSRGLRHRIGQGVAAEFHQVFLSEDRKAWLVMHRMLSRIFRGETELLSNYGDPDVLYFAQTLKKVSRERHRMKAFVRFGKSLDGMYVATIEPDFNVLPLISDFFRKRYADQAWMIYDVRRKYGLLYDKNTVSEVILRPDDGSGPAMLPSTVMGMDGREELFQRLWKQYFSSTNIPARKNRRLHLQHVPRRYWKYLTEKT